MEKSFNKTMHIIFSHSLTDLQVEEARQSLNITNFNYLPSGLLKKWSNVPSDILDISDYLEIFKEWLMKSAVSGDYVLLAGDFGAVYELVILSFKLNLLPIYATTRRIHKERKNRDGSIQIEKKFCHQLFRRFRKL